MRILTRPNRAGAPLIASYCILLQVNLAVDDHSIYWPELYGQLIEVGIFC